MFRAIGFARAVVHTSAVMFLFMQGGYAAEKVAAEPLSGLTGSGPGGPHEGIKVHGHWTIDVRDPDGILVTHREFENALFDGAFLLGPLLGRTYTAGGWLLAVSGPCIAVSNICTLVESTDPFYTAGPSVFKTVTVNAPLPNTPGAGTLTLTGSFVAQIASQISQVSSGLENCAPTVAPAGCPAVASSNNFYFSKATIAPIAVTAGQAVQVTVVFSFS